MDGGLKVLIVFLAVLFGGAFLFGGDALGVLTVAWEVIKWVGILAGIGLLLAIGGFAVEKWRRLRYLEDREKRVQGRGGEG